MTEPEAASVTPEALDAALRPRIQGDVLTDRYSLTAYATAACIYRIRPRAVVVPASADDVVAAVQVGRDLGVPIVPRGAGSGLCGQALGRGIVLDFTRHMNRVLGVDPAAKTVRLEPGAVTRAVNEAAAEHGLMIGADPSSEEFSSIGGNLGTNASGARGIRYGSTRDYVAYLDVVLADGTRARLEPVATGSDAFRAVEGRADLLGRVVRGTRRLLADHADAIAARRPYTSKNSAGYNLWGVEEGGVLDLTRLVVGSEGTLAVIVEAGLRLVEKPAARGSLLLWFESLEKAGEAVAPVLDLGPSACEIMERCFLDIVRADGSVPREYLPEKADTVLLVEQLGDSREANAAFLARVRTRIVDELGLAFDAVEAHDPAEQERLWMVRKRAVQILQRLPGPKRVTAFIEDVSVPPDRLVDYIRGLRAILETHQVEAAIYGHAGDANLHARPMVDTRVAEDVVKIKAIAGEVAHLVTDLGGTVSCEHGDGLTRSAYLELQFGDLYDVMREVKRVWDPAGVLNPGKVVTEAREIHLDDLRLPPGTTPRPTGDGFDRQRWADELIRCHGCGTCRAYCPVYKVTGEERATPRGKANLLREAICGELTPGDLSADAMREVAALCYNCKTCLAECPSHVDVPGLILRHKEHLAERGNLGLRERAILDVRTMGRLGSLMAPVANWFTRRRPVRYLMDKLGGLSRRAAMPRFQHARLREGETAAPDGEPALKIAYFAGCFELFNEPQIGRAALEVLTTLGGEVFVPEQRCCGVPRISVGDAKGALKDMAHNLDVLAALADAGYVIASGCPSCVGTLTEDYPDMAEGDPRAATVAEATRDVHEIVAELVRGRPAADAGPWAGRRLGYHAPCHLRVAGRGNLPKELLERTLGLAFAVTNDVCCGMGGTFGLKTKNAPLAEAIAEPVMQRFAEAGCEAVVTSCGMCRTQLAAGTGLPVYHPMEVLADALTREPVGGG